MLQENDKAWVVMWILRSNVVGDSTQLMFRHIDSLHDTFVCGNKKSCDIYLSLNISITSWIAICKIIINKFIYCDLFSAVYQQQVASEIILHSQR